MENKWLAEKVCHLESGVVLAWRAWRNSRRRPKRRSRRRSRRRTKRRSRRRFKRTSGRRSRRKSKRTSSFPLTDFLCLLAFCYSPVHNPETSWLSSFSQRYLRRFLGFRAYFFRCSTGVRTWEELWMKPPFRSRLDFCHVWILMYQITRDITCCRCRWDGFSLVVDVEYMRRIFFTTWPEQRKTTKNLPLLVCSCFNQKSVCFQVIDSHVIKASQDDGLNSAQVLVVYERNPSRVFLFGILGLFSRLVEWMTGTIWDKYSQTKKKPWLPWMLKASSFLKGLYLQVFRDRNLV